MLPDPSALQSWLRFVWKGTQMREIIAGQSSVWCGQPISTIGKKSRIVSSSPLKYRVCWCRWQLFGNLGRDLWDPSRCCSWVAIIFLYYVGDIVNSVPAVNEPEVQICLFADSCMFMLWDKSQRDHKLLNNYWSDTSGSYETWDTNLNFDKTKEQILEYSYIIHH